jgi:hypothetical protein
MGRKTLLQRVPRNLMTAYIAVRRFRLPSASALAGGRTFKEQPQAKPREVNARRHGPGGGRYRRERGLRIVSSRPIEDVWEARSKGLAHVEAMTIPQGMVPAGPLRVGRRADRRT